ncbi:hypothetical protein KVR01_008766 [Diaporthe batatas]|uniref:uncharacterized protein n=1 Tax=Diaporthe batatas TaxID=748121 RepID=UPI001D039094|nr:uncharacterized protein KVR01_008766 [Diaporthe batatas]KAG8161779.1 hypothetical protein KVR01_008766 [Diaporthe batatas]
MLGLRSKLHLVRQGRKSSPRLISDSPCLLDNEYDPATAAPTQRAGSTSAPEPSHLPSWSAPRRLALDTLPDHIVQDVAIFCGPDAILGLRHTCRSLHRALDSPDFWAEIARRRMDPPTNGTPGRDALIQMIKAQMDSDDFMTRDQDARRDAFLCLAVTLPPRQRARIKATMGPLLARARIKGSGRGPPPEAASDRTSDDQQGQRGQQGQQDQPDKKSAGPLPDQNGNDCDVAAEIETRLGLMSTLCVLGYSDVCDVDLGRALMAINPWTMRANIWSEKKLLAQKQLSLQLAFTMTLGLIHPWNWSNVPAEAPEYKSLAQRVMADYHAQDFTSSNQSFWLSWEGLHTRSLQLAGLMAYILKTSGLEDTPRSDLIPLLRDTASQSNSDKVPTPSSLPPTQLKIPLLEKTKGGRHGGITGQSNSWQEWYTSRVRDLVNTIDQDDDDEWYGYYVYTLTSTENRNPIGSKDPAMENIHFRLGRPPPPPPTPTSTTTTTKKRSSPTPQPPQKLPLEARDCQDGITRSFDLVGTVAPATGIVSLRKSYVGAHSWDYEGVMTPLGIVGEWGKEETGFNGYFWLWRRSWMGGGGGAGGAGEEGRGQQTYAYS